MTKMTGLLEAETPKTAKIRTNRMPKWVTIILIVIVIAAIAIPVSFWIDRQTKLQNTKEELIARQNIWQKAEHKLIETNNELSGKNLALTEENEQLESLAEKRLNQRNRALADAIREKEYGKEMEELALSHAGKVSKLRVENNELSRELDKKKAETEGYKADNKRLEERIMMFKNMIEHMKNEIARISESYQDLLDAQRKK